MRPGSRSNSRNGRSGARTACRRSTTATVSSARWASGDVCLSVASPSRGGPPARLQAAARSRYAGLCSDLAGGRRMAVLFTTPAGKARVDLDLAGATVVPDHLARLPAHRDNQKLCQRLRRKASSPQAVTGGREPLLSGGGRESSPPEQGRCVYQLFEDIRIPRRLSAAGCNAAGHGMGHHPRTVTPPPVRITSSPPCYPQRNSTSSIYLRIYECRPISHSGGGRSNVLFDPVHSRLGMLVELRPQSGCSGPTVGPSGVVTSRPEMMTGQHFLLIRPYVEPPAGIEPATPSPPFVLPRTCGGGRRGQAADAMLVDVS